MLLSFVDFAHNGLREAFGPGFDGVELHGANGNVLIPSCSVWIDIKVLSISESMRS